MSATSSSERAIAVEGFSAVRRGSLRGFAKVVLPSGMILFDVAIHVDSGRAWAMPSSKPMLNKDGQVVRDETGKIRYLPIVGFTSKKLHARFSHQVIEAVRVAHSEALL